MGGHKVEGVAGHDACRVVRVRAAEAGVIVRCPRAHAPVLVHLSGKIEVTAPRNAAVKAVREAGVSWCVKGSWRAHAGEIVYHDNGLFSALANGQDLRREAEAALVEGRHLEGVHVAGLDGNAVRCARDVLAGVKGAVIHSGVYPVASWLCSDFK